MVIDLSGEKSLDVHDPPKYLLMIGDDVLLHLPY